MREPAATGRRKRLNGMKPWAERLSTQGISHKAPPSASVVIYPVRSLPLWWFREPQNKEYRKYGVSSYLPIDLWRLRKLYAPPMNTMECSYYHGVTGGGLGMMSICTRCQGSFPSPEHDYS